MIPGGYILQPRSFDKSDASKFPPVTRELWFYLLRNVNHSDNGKFKRGTGFFNLGEIQKDLCWYSGYRKNTYSKPQLTKSLRRLCESNMVATTKATRGIVITVCNYSVYQDSKNYEGNGGGSTEETRRKREGHTINKNDKNERITTEEVKEVILYLNEKTGKRFSTETKSTITSIKARLEEGWKLSDFKTAIDNQCRSWQGTDYEKHLNPDTLFRPSKFEKYVNNISTKKPFTDYSRY